MNTELRLELTRTCSKHHGKIANDNSFTDLAKILTCQKQQQVSMFRASKQHATGTYHGKQRHGMLVIKVYNKTPLLRFSQICTENTVASMQTWQVICTKNRAWQKT